MIRNFLMGVCGCSGTFTIENREEKAINEIKGIVGDKSVLVRDNCFAGSKQRRKWDIHIHTHSLTHSLTHTHTLTHTHSHTHSFTHSLTPSLTHSLTHSLSLSLSLSLSTSFSLNLSPHTIRPSPNCGVSQVMVSGGVDSAVCAALLNKALGPKRVIALHIDNGFMRLDESKQGVCCAHVAVGPLHTQSKARSNTHTLTFTCTDSLTSMCS